MGKKWSWQDKPAEFFLMWYSLDTELLVGEEKLAISDEQIIDWFFSSCEFVYAEPVQASHKLRLQPYVKHKIDLNEYDYFIEYLIDNTKS